MIFLPSSTLVPSETDKPAEPEADFLDRGDHAFGNDIALHDAAENVDQNAFGQPDRR